ncbi:hypothetical protein WKI13_08915 [Teredinibacter turnerae]|uniref:hypothetical protein n=1 Tax=Teredinibacter turnerae TaxID=2426 RepID=UPI0012F970AF|nr:hypothetical protein [Teredinibacter turnerae]
MARSSRAAVEASARSDRLGTEISGLKRRGSWLTIGEKNEVIFTGRGSLSGGEKSHSAKTRRQCRVDGDYSSR